LASVLFSLLLSRSVHAALTCLDVTGNPVDYWAIIKYPGGIGGLKYLYWDSNLKAAKFKEIKTAVDDPKTSPLMLTLAQVYAQAKTISYAMYSDQTPDGVSHGAAHSKGVIALSPRANAGFWLTHSLPKFPNAVADGLGPLPSKTFAQDFFCMAINSTAFTTLLKQIAVNRPTFYDSNIGKLPSAKETSSVAAFGTSAGFPLLSFAKSKNYGKDIWDSLIAPYIEEDFVVQTWKSGSGGNLPSSCTSAGFPYNVMNEDVINGPTHWNDTQDHSKWGVTVGKGASPYVCYGDVNRQESQETRGGGAVCIADPKLWASMTAIVGAYEAC